MNFASSQTAKEMSGQVQLDRYMHFPTIAQEGSFAAATRSSSVVGHIELVRRKVGQGVLTELQCSMLKSDKICLVYCSWSSIRNLRCLHLRMRQPRSHSVSPLSMIANCFLICVVAKSDSALESDARRRSSTLVAEIVRAEGNQRIYTLQSDWQRVKPRDEYAS
jgi:hypothetical protein